MSRKLPKQNRSPIDPDSLEPISRQLAGLLAKEILSGRLAPGTKMIERTLSQRYGVSRTPLRSALQILAAQGLVHCPPRRRAVVAEVKPGAARASTAGTILVRQGLPYPTRSDPPSPDTWYSVILVGIQAEARALGYAVQTETFHDPVRIPLSSYVPPSPSQVGGVILYGAYDDRYIRMFHAEHVPLVVVDYWTRDLQTDCVAVDVESEACAVVDFLVQRGHTSLGFVATGRHSRGSRALEYDPDVARLLNSLRQAVQGTPLAMRDEWVLLASTRAVLLSQELPRYLAAASRPTALLCFQSDIALDVLAAAGNQSLRCPQDFSLLGRGGPGSFHGELVTHVASDPHLLGRMAVRLLAERMHGLRTHPVKLALPSQLVIGSTTGPAPEHAERRT